MKLTAIIQRPIAGTPIKRMLQVDGTEYTELTYYLSRKLTGTTDERNAGIFSGKSTLWRNALELKFDFGNDLDFINYNDAATFLAEVERRIMMVREGFLKTFPVHKSEATLEIADEIADEIVKSPSLSTIPVLKALH